MSSGMSWDLLGASVRLLLGYLGVTTVQTRTFVGEAAQSRPRGARQAEAPPRSAGALSCDAPCAEGARVAGAAL
jgi:hypothetical protein